MKLLLSQRVLYPPYNHAPRHFTARSYKGLQTQEPTTRPTQYYRHQQFKNLPHHLHTSENKTNCLHHVLVMPGNDVLACWVRSQNVLPGQVGLPCLTQAEKTQHQSTWPCCMLLLPHKPDPAPAYMTILHVIITTQARPSTSLHDHAACYYNTSPNFIGAVSSWSFSLPISVLPTLRQ